MKRKSPWQQLQTLICCVALLLLFVTGLLCLTGHIRLEFRPNTSVFQTDADAPAWESICPGLYAPKANIGTVKKEKTVYLTFNGGPSERTPEILEVLKQYGIKATFFVIGNDSTQYIEWLQDIAAAGHTIGMLSSSNDYPVVYASIESFLKDYQQLYEQIQRATGTAPAICRFPGGSINGYNSAIYQELISEITRRGFVYFDWNVNAQDGDGAAATAEQIAENALSGSGRLRRPIILLHNGADKLVTVQALSQIIEGYKAAGYSFAALTPEVLPVIYSYLN